MVGYGRIEGRDMRIGVTIKSKFFSIWYIFRFLILWIESSLYSWGEVSCPATRHRGVWGVRRYSSYSFLTSALDGGEWSASRPGRALLPGKGPQVPIG
jgi:hypothetical protein